MYTYFIQKLNDLKNEMLAPRILQNRNDTSDNCDENTPPSQVELSLMDEDLSADNLISPIQNSPPRQVELRSVEQGVVDIPTELCCISESDAIENKVATSSFKQSQPFSVLSSIENIKMPLKLLHLDDQGDPPKQ